MNSAFKRHLWWVGGTLFVLQFVSMGAMEMSGPFWSIYLRGLTNDDITFSFASTAVYIGPMIGIALSSGFWGKMGDKYGHRLMMIRALLGLAATQLLIALTIDVWLIAILRLFQGLLAGYIMPAQAYATKYTDKAGRVRLFAWLQIATNVGSLGGAVIGGSILDVASFPVINITAAIICFICALLVWWLLPKDKQSCDKNNSEQKNKGNIDKTIYDKTQLSTFSLYSILLLSGGLLTARMVLQVPFALYMAKQFEAPYKVTGTAYGLMALGFIIAAPIWAEKLKYARPVVILNMVGGVAILCAILTFFAGYTTNLTLFCALYLIWGMALGGTTPILTALASQFTDSKKQGAVLGRAQSIQQTASVLGIGIGALFSQAFSLDVVFPLATVIYFTWGLFSLIIANHNDIKYYS